MKRIVIVGAAGGVAPLGAGGFFLGNHTSSSMSILPDGPDAKSVVAVVRPACSAEITVSAGPANAKKSYVGIVDLATRQVKFTGDNLDGNTVYNGNNGELRSTLALSEAESKELGIAGAIAVGNCEMETRRAFEKAAPYVLRSNNGPPKFIPQSYEIQGTPMDLSPTKYLPSFSFIKTATP